MKLFKKIIDLWLDSYVDSYNVYTYTDLYIRHYEYR